MKLATSSKPKVKYLHLVISFLPPLPIIGDRRHYVFWSSPSLRPLTHISSDTIISLISTRISVNLPQLYLPCGWAMLKSFSRSKVKVKVIMTRAYVLTMWRQVLLSWRGQPSAICIIVITCGRCCSSR